MAQVAVSNDYRRDSEEERARSLGEKWPTRTTALTTDSCYCVAVLACMHTRADLRLLGEIHAARCGILEQSSVQNSATPLDDASQCVLFRAPLSAGEIQ
eukprot:6176736-Pleurochrysis_carterae.AAC.2